MSRPTSTLPPAARRLLEALGQRLHQARLRRRLSAAQVAERAGMSRTTLRAIERGAPGATVAAYLSVLFVLGLEQDLAAIARDDELGRRLQDAQLPTRIKG